MDSGRVNPFRRGPYRFDIDGKRYVRCFGGCDEHGRKPLIVLHRGAVPLVEDAGPCMRCNGTGWVIDEYEPPPEAA